MFTELDNLNLSNEEFWRCFADLVIDVGPAIQDHNVTIRKLLTEDRCLDVHARFAAMTDEEVAWMGAKKRRGKPIRIYRAATIGNLTAFRFHTNVMYALEDLPEGTMRAHLFTGEVDIDSILFRLSDGGRKLVIVSPDRVRAIKVQELVHPDAVKDSETHELKPLEETIGLGENLDSLEEEAAEVSLDLVDLD